jgi:hypothetical protein
MAHGPDYGKEIWALYESGALHPDVELTGHFEHIAGARVGDRISPTIRGG